MSREGEFVTLEKGHEGLGIHIRGGTDFPFIKTKDVTDPGIFIVHISDGGYAQRDGRLKVIPCSWLKCLYVERATVLKILDRVSSPT